MTAQSTKARQAAYKARQRAAGMVRIAEWVYEADAPTVRAILRALRHTRERATGERKATT